LISRIAALLLVVFAVSCAGAPPPPPPSRDPKTAQWQDVFDGVPEFYVVVRPQALKRDATYGNFVKVLTRVAEARGDLGMSTLQAADASEEVVLGINRANNADDTALVLRGVPASMDAEKLTDASGHRVFTLVDGKSKIHEYEHYERGGITASLFVLPDRTWVYTLGSARARAREAFAHPFGRPVPKVDADALALIRVDAQTPWIGAVQKGQNLGPVLRKLRAATLALKAGANGLVLSLLYSDEDGAAWAEMQGKRLLEDMVRTSTDAQNTHRRIPRTFDLAKDARVSREANTVLVKMTIPQQLLADLPQASANDLPL
jgi:hypothetical protein